MIKSYFLCLLTKSAAVTIPLAYWLKYNLNFGAFDSCFMFNSESLQFVSEDLLDTKWCHVYK